jgi:hypothetical protein
LGTLRELSNEELDRLKPSDVEEIKADLWGSRNTEQFRGLKSNGDVVIVAEGDSWFNYSIAGFDILDFLADYPNYAISKFASPGDTLENMVYGTEYRNGSFTAKPPQIEEVLGEVRERQPRFFLFSGGGNDIVGDEFGQYLNHIRSGLPALKVNNIEYMVSVVYKTAFEKLCEMIWNIDDSIDIITHGYAYAIPDGRGVGSFFGFNFVGPWLLPAFTEKRITNEIDQKNIIRNMIDNYNAMLRSLDVSNDRFHVIDLRPEIAEWSCLGTGGNSRTAISERVDVGLIRRPGQGRRARWAGKASPIRRPCAWRSGRRRGAPRAAWARSRRRAARSGS